jgi:hypothetical protein
MIKKIEWLFEDRNELIRISNQGLVDVKGFSWKKISELYKRQLYKKNYEDKYFY